MSALPTPPTSTTPDSSLEPAQANSQKGSWWNRLLDECFDFKLEFSVLESRPKFCSREKLARAKLKLVACNPHLIRTASRAKLQVVKPGENLHSHNKLNKQQELL
jgi:hypothetical protein